MDRYDKMILLTVLKIVFKKDLFPGGKKPGNDLEISPVSPILYTMLSHGTLPFGSLSNGETRGLSTSSYFINEFMNHMTQKWFLSMWATFLQIMYCQ